MSIRLRNHSTPCLSFTVTEMLLAILSICTQEELAESEESEEGAPSMEDLAARRQVIKNKILAVGRMQRVFQLLRFVTSLFGR